MAKTVRLHKLEDLANHESKHGILLETRQNTELHIQTEYDRTIIKLPFGNKFDIIGGNIVIYEKP